MAPIIEFRRKIIFFVDLKVSTAWDLIKYTYNKTLILNLLIGI
jgi:hypothetical protein